MIINPVNNIAWLIKYISPKYYISEEYKQKCAKDGSILCQEYTTQYLRETANVLKKFLEGVKNDNK